MAAIAMLPGHANAYNFTQTSFISGTQVCPGAGFTQRVVGCVKENILFATNSFLDDFFPVMFNILAACLTLAVAFWGVMVATGHRRAPVAGAFTLAMKGAVLITLFGTTAYNFQAFFGMILDGMEDLLNVVTTYSTYTYSFTASCPTYGGVPVGGSMGIWYRIDCMLDGIIGRIMPSSSIALGLGGFLVAAMMSTTAGIFIGFMGFFFIVDLLFAIFRSVYIFIMAYMAMAVMAIIAPIFLPMILFSVTRGYFEKWLKLSLGFVLQPVFLFAYLAMLLAAVDTVVFTGPMSIYRTLAGGNELSSYHRFPTTFRIGNWLLSNGVLGKSSTGTYAVNVNTRHNATQGLQDIETGIAGKVAEATTRGSDWDKTAWSQAGHENIYQALGIQNSFFMIDFPTDVVSWRDMACKNLPSGSTSCSTVTGIENTTSNYMINVFLSIIMALTVIYIFKLMLNFLPFIGIGIVGDVLSTPNLGYDRFAPPGEGAVSSLRSKLAGGG